MLIGEQTESLIIDTFVQNMNNKMVQQKLSTEPKRIPKKPSESQARTQKG